MNTHLRLNVFVLEFALEAIAGSNYDANDPGGGAGSDSGESSQTGGNHAYAFKFKSNYESVSNNPLKGNGDFDNNKVDPGFDVGTYVEARFGKRNVTNPNDGPATPEQIASIVG